MVFVMPTSSMIERADPTGKESHEAKGWPHFSSKTRACMCFCGRCMGVSGCICKLCSGVGHTNCSRADRVDGDYVSVEVDE